MVTRLNMTMLIVDPLVIGGAAGVHADIEPIKTEDSVLIPGTSIKGVLRTIAESQCLCDQETIVRLFGGDGVMGSLRVSSVSFRLNTVTQTRISIDPLSGKVKRGALYTVELLVPCSTGRFTIELYTENEEMIKCLLKALGQLRVYGLGRGRARVDIKVEQGIDEKLLKEYGLSDWLWRDEWVSICGQH